MLKLAFLNLFRRKSRSLLALLGIAIGISALILMNGVVDGIYYELDTLIGSFQAIMVMEEGTMDQTLSRIDLSLESRIASVSGVRIVVPEVWVIPSTIDGKAPRIDSMASMSTIVYGVDLSSYNRLRGQGWIGELERGQTLRSSDRGQVLLGKTLADNLNKFVGSTIRINEKNFRVRGITKSETEMLGSIILMDIEDARSLADFPADKVNSFYVEIDNPAEDKKITQQLNFILGPGIEAGTASDYSDSFSGILDTFRITALAISLIAAFVAGISIMNTMLMSVMERFKEIGALKATGWSNFNVMQLIVFESVLISLVGGILGILLSFAVSTQLPEMGLPILITIDSIILACVFAFSVGLIAGLYPAYKASELDPVEAMKGV